MLKEKERIALFIDADNAPAVKIDVILSELARYGVVNIRRAYGNWKSPNMQSWENVLHEFAIQPIQQFDLTKGKNATDIALVIDAMDVLYTREIDIICLVSSDCDFTPLVTRAKAEGKAVFGFGERKAPANSLLKTPVAHTAKPTYASTLVHFCILILGLSHCFEVLR